MKYTCYFHRAKIGFVDQNQALNYVLKNTRVKILQLIIVYQSLQGCGLY